MTYSFGRSFTYTFTPLADESPVAAIPAQSPAVYVFAALPSLAAARAGTGAVATVAAWTPVGAGFDIPVSALDDPDPTGPVREHTYYIAVNFKLEVGGQTQTVLRALSMERVTGSEGKVRVADAEILALLPQASSFSTEAERVQFLRQAELQVKDDLQAAKFRWSRIHRLDDLSRVVLYKALLLLLFSQFRDGGDRYKAKYDEIKGWYAAALAGLAVEYVPDDAGGTPEAVSTSASSVTLIR